MNTKQQQPNEQDTYSANRQVIERLVEGCCDEPVILPESENLAEINRMAISLLSKASYSEAIVAFLSATPPQRCSSTEMDNISTEEAVIRTVPCRSPDQPETGTTTPTVCSRTDNINPLLMYDQAFHFTNNTSIDEDSFAVLTTARQCNQFAVATIYNTALALHLQAQHCPDQRNLNLMKANKIYEFALEAHFENTRTNQADPFSDFMAMAIMNNMMSIHAHFQRISFLDACRRSLVYYLRSVSAHPGMVSRKDLALFTHNVLFFGDGNHFQKAPAA